jgi:hypothetical protein
MVHSSQTVHPSWVKISTISEKGPKRASTSASSLSGTIRCVQNDFYAYGTSSTNHAPFLHRHKDYLQMKRSEFPHDPCHLGVPSGESKRFSSLWYLRCKLCTYLLSRLALSLNGLSFYLSLITSDTIRCVQNDFRADVMFGANCTSILHRH